MAKKFRKVRTWRNMNLPKKQKHGIGASSFFRSSLATQVTNHASKHNYRCPKNNKTCALEQRRNWNKKHLGRLVAIKKVRRTNLLFDVCFAFQ